MTTTKDGTNTAARDAEHDEEREQGPGEPDAGAEVNQKANNRPKRMIIPTRDHKYKDFMCD